MESWRIILWEGLFPQLSTEVLYGLKDALEEPLTSTRGRLVHGVTTLPEFHCRDLDKPCQSGCLIAYCGLLEEYTTVFEVNDYFCQILRGITERLPQSDYQDLLDFWDRTPTQARREILAEVQQEIERRDEAEWDAFVGNVLDLQGGDNDVTESTDRRYGCDLGRGDPW